MLWNLFLRAHTLWTIALDSMVNDNEVLKLVQQFKQSWRKAEMHPRKWLSNSKKVLREIDMKDR